MIIDNSINQYIDNKLLDDNAKRDEEHKASGKLSASMLYQPVRFQVLKTIGVPRKAIDPYTLGKFKRGNDVEEWCVDQLEGMGVLIAKHELLTYRVAVGYVDAIVDSNKLQFKQDRMPHEVKSVTNAKLRRIAKTGVDWHYKLQASFYARAMTANYYAVDIVSAEDLRPNIYIFKTREMIRDIDKAIDAYQEAMKAWKDNKVLPKFEANPRVKWTGNKKYAMFDEKWIDGSDELTIKMIEEL